MCGVDALLTNLSDLNSNSVDLGNVDSEHVLTDTDSQWKKHPAAEIIKQIMCFLSSWEELSLFTMEAGGRILNVLSIPSFGLIFFLKGEITQDGFGSVSIHLIQPFLGYFIFTVYKLSPFKG